MIAEIGPLSSGGGCDAARSGGGFRITACISARNYTVYPDFYLDAVPADRSNCTIRAYVYRNGSRGPQHTYSCAVGHVNVPSYGGGGTFFLRVYADNYGTTWVRSDSPNLYN
jgi:hypothetical protein